MIKRFDRIAVALMTLIILAGCGAQRNAVSSKTGVGHAEIKSITDARVGLRVAAESWRAWEYAKIPLTVNLQSPKSVSIGGTAWLERDKSVLISLKYFGFEIGCLHVTSDSIKVVDKMHKCFVALPVGSSLGGFPMTVANIQDLLLGRAFVVGSDKLSSKDISDGDIDVDSVGGWTFIPKNGRGKRVEYGFSFSATGQVLALLAQSGVHQPVICRYGSSVESMCGVFADRISVEAVVGTNKIAASIEWNIDKAKWDKDASRRNYSIPDSYKQISDKDILRMLKNL